MTQTTGTPTPGMLPAVYENLLAAIDQAVDYADTLAWTMSEDQLTTLVSVLANAASRVQHVELLTVGEAQARDLPAKAGATTTANWWAHQTRHTRQETNRRVATLRRLRQQPAVSAAALSGQLLTDQSEVIASAVAKLPTDLVDATTSHKAQSYLLGQAAHWDAKGLAAQAKHLLTVIAPDIGEAHDAKLLADQEKAGDLACTFTSHDDGNGRYHFRGILPTRYRAIIETAIHKHLPPAAPQSDEPPRTAAQRRGQAFCRFLDSRTDLNIAVTMTLDTLTGGLASASLWSGEPLSPGEARKLACTARLIPVVLDGDSRPLDVGRSSRFYTNAQTVAMALRDRGCTVDGCHHPPSACDAHHDTRWTDGGNTDLAQGRLLCQRHHTLIHDHRYEAVPAPAGRIRLIMRT